MSREHEDGGSLVPLLTGIGVGVVLGGAIALLLAPQAGAETRARLRDGVDDTLHRLKDTLEDLRVKLDDVSAHARELLPSRREAGGPDHSGDVAGSTDEPPSP